jgi:hypothetical protein
MAKQPEKILETRILDYLNSIQNCFAFKTNQVGIYDPKRKTFRKNNNRHVHNGMCDIHFCYAGNFGAIEVKVGSNKPSLNQTKYIKRILENGGVAWWTKDFEECRKTFHQTFPQAKFKNPPMFEEQF